MEAVPKIFYFLLWQPNKIKAKTEIFLQGTFKVENYSGQIVDI